MSTYCYTLRAKTKNVNIDGEFRAVPVFEFAYGNVGSWNFSDRTEAIHERQLAAAERAFDKFSVQPEGGGPNLVVALDGDWIVVTNLSNYIDAYTLEERHKVVIGRVVRVSGRLQCVAQNTTTDLAIQSLSYDAQDRVRRERLTS